MFFIIMRHRHGLEIITSNSGGGDYFPLTPPLQRRIFTVDLRGKISTALCFGIVVVETFFKCLTLTRPHLFVEWTYNDLKEV